MNWNPTCTKENLLIVKYHLWWDQHPTTSGEWKQGVDPHTFKWNLLQDIILQEATTNQWMDLITTSSPTSFLSTPRTRTPTGRIYQAKHVSESSCKWLGVYVVLHRTAIFTFVFVSDKCFKEAFFTFFSLEYMKFILILTGIHNQPFCALPPHCVTSRTICGDVISCGVPPHHHRTTWS